MSEHDFEQTNTTFDDLPDEIVLYISDFLSITDVCRFSNVNKKLRSILPRCSGFLGYDIEEHGPSGGHWIPSHYLDGPVMESKLKQLRISMKWKDQVPNIGFL